MRDPTNAPPPSTGSAFTGLRRMDRLRRAQGAGLERLGFGPRPTPSRIPFARPGLRLHTYAEAKGASGLPILIVPAPIKRAYVWDLAPDVSVVRRCRDAGLDTWMIEWTEPAGEVAEYGLSDYAGALIGECIEAIRAARGVERVVLAGHSLGGTLAALHAAAWPERVAGLLLIEAPLRFGAASGAFAPAVAAVSDGWLTAVAEQGPVPGSFLNLASIGAAPESFLGAMALDRLASALNPGLAANHLRVQRWTLDEFAMPGPLFAEIVQQLYREDRFARGGLALAGREVRPEAMDMPVLAVIDPLSRVVPPASALDPLGAAGREPVVLHYAGEVGIGLRHVGALVGPDAHRRLWPSILDWLGETARALPTQE